MDSPIAEIGPIPPADLWTEAQMRLGAAAVDQGAMSPETVFRNPLNLWIVPLHKRQGLLPCQ
jgi:hypothetical protein